MTKTVLISINSSWNIVNFRAGLIRALSADNYRVISAAPADAHTERLRGMVAEHYELAMESDGTSPLRDLALILRYWKLLRRTRPDIMLTYTIKPNIYGAIAARLCGVPVIANVSGLGTAFIRTTWLTRVVKHLYRLAFRQVALVFFQNAVDRDLFIAQKLVAREKTDLLPGSGVDLAYFHPSHAVADDGQVRFVLIGRMVWDKGIAEYVAAARLVKQQYPQVQFHLVGAQHVKNKTAIAPTTLAEWNQEGIVQYLGESDDIREVIAQHSCVVLPSYREGMSRVLLEAAAMGKPLIATNVPGCADVVEDGVNGLLCAAQDAASLADAMLRFLALPVAERAAMGVASRRKAEKEFDEQRVFDSYLSHIAAAIR